MLEPPDARPRRRSSPLHEALRWLIAIPIATVVAFGLFVAMSKLADGSWILGALMRVFPLHQTQLDPRERCEGGSLRISPALTVEGSVGYLADGRFVPLGDAEIRTQHGVGANRGIEVDAEGRFRFATALPGAAAEGCPGEPSAGVSSTPLVIFRAPGCEERRVPVTRAWVPHRILLSCDARS